MVFKKYFLKRFFLHVFSVAIGLTLLFNLIEFFEKLVREKTTVETVFRFVTLNLIPTFFINLPIAAWLASCMTIKEMHQQNEWEISQLLSISTKNIFFLLAFAGTTLALFSLAGKELITHEITQAAEKMRQEKFKQKRNKRLINKWFMLKENRFCHMQYLDTEKGEGQDLSLFNVSPEFKIEEIRSAPKFKISLKENNLIIDEGALIVIKENRQEMIQNETLHLPNFFTQLSVKSGPPSIARLFSLTINNKNTLPTSVYNQLLASLLDRILSHLLLILYPLLTFAFFFLFPFHRFYRWVAIFLPYPLVIVLSTVTDFLVQHFQNGLIVTIPYAILTAMMVAMVCAVRK